MTDIQPVPNPTPVPSKPAWMSKTLWVSAILAVAPLVFPAAAVWIASNPQVFSVALGLIFAGLRLITHGKVDIS